MPPQGTWWTAIPWPVRALIGVGLVLGVFQLLKNAAPENRVIVNCQGTGAAYSCSVEHQQGNDTVNACWDIVATCQGGVRSTAHACHEVSHAQSVTHLVPISDFQNAAACQMLIGVTVENLVLTAR